MDLNTLLDEYETVYLPAKNAAPRTRVEYGRDLRQFVDFLAGRGVAEVDQIGLRELNGFLAHLEGLGLSGSSRRRKTYTLKSFFNFLEEHRHTRENVAHRLVPPQVESREPRVLSDEEYQRLQLQVRGQHRDAAIIELMLQTGIRLGELAKLTLGDVRLPTKITVDPEHTGELRVRQGKGRKDRYIDLNYKVCWALKAYLETRPPVPSPALFVSKFKRAMTPRGIQKRLEKHLIAAGISEAHPHSLRHTAGTHLIAAGASPRTVQELLGHKSLATTSLYISLARKQSKKDVQAYAL